MGAETARTIGESTGGEVLLLENLRFYTAEEGKGEINGEKVKATAQEIADFRR